MLTAIIGGPIHGSALLVRAGSTRSAMLPLLSHLRRIKINDGLPTVPVSAFSGFGQDPVTGQLDENFTSSVSLALTVKLSAPLGM